MIRPSHSDRPGKYLVFLGQDTSLEGARFSCETGQKFARGRPGRFRATRWSIEFPSAHLVAEGRLGHEHGAPAHLPELR